MEHTKSTELLIPSDTSMEEIYVPPLDLSKSVDDDTSFNDMPSTSESRINEVNPTTILVVDPADIHHTQDNVGPVPAPRRKPIPAARNTVQMMQASELNQKEIEIFDRDNAIELKLSPIKETKESLSQNSELHTSVQELIGKSDKDKVKKKSESKIKKLEKITRKKFSTNLSEIRSIHQEKKMKMKKKLFREENDETTSFIIENENIDADTIPKESEPTMKLANGDQKSSDKSKKISIESRKSKSKKDKQKVAEEKQTVHTELNETDVKQNYDYKKMIGKLFDVQCQSKLMLKSS